VNSPPTKNICIRGNCLFPAFCLPFLFPTVREHQTFAQLVFGWRKVDGKLMFNFNFPLFGEKIFEFFFYGNIAKGVLKLLSCLTGFQDFKLNTSIKSSGFFSIANMQRFV
jgi:hypothetical protein